MRNETFDRAVTQLLERGSKYPRKAYELLSEAMDYTMRRLHDGERENAHGEVRAHPTHISGQELSIGFKDYLLNEYGPFAVDLLQSLNMTQTQDIGNLVYDLISVGCFTKNEQDRIEDFADVYDFNTAFVAPFDVKAPEFYSK